MKAPIYVMLATLCGAAPDQTIREAQWGLVDPAQHILPGPDSDVLGDEREYWVGDNVADV